MNGYKMMADSYRKLINNGKINNDTAEKEILVYEFLSTCDINDCCRMLDIYAFNDIIRAFLKITVENADIDKKSQDKVINQLRFIFDEKISKGKVAEWLKIRLN